MLNGFWLAFVGYLFISTSGMAKTVRFSEESQGSKIKTLYTKRATDLQYINAIQGQETGLNPYISEFKHEVEVTDGGCEIFWQKIEEVWEAIDSYGLRATSLDSCSDPRSLTPGSKIMLSLHMLVGPDETSGLDNLESFLSDFNGYGIYGQPLDFFKVSRMISNIITSLGISERAATEYMLIHRNSSVKSFNHLPAFITFYNEAEDTIREAPGDQILSLLNTIYDNFDYSFLLSQVNVIDVLIQNIVTTIDEKVIEIPRGPVVTAV